VQRQAPPARDDEESYDDDENVFPRLNIPAPPLGAFDEDPEVQHAILEHYSLENLKRKRVEEDLSDLGNKLDSAEIGPNRYAMEKKVDALAGVFAETRLQPNQTNISIYFARSPIRLLPPPVGVLAPAPVAARSSNSQEAHSDDEYQQVTKRYRGPDAS